MSAKRIVLALVGLGIGAAVIYWLFIRKRVMTEAEWQAAGRPRGVVVTGGLQPATGTTQAVRYSTRQYQPYTITRRKLPSGYPGEYYYHWLATRGPIGYPAKYYQQIYYAGGEYY